MLTVSFHSTKTFGAMCSCFLSHLLSLFCGSTVCSMQTQLFSTAVETPGRALWASTDLAVTAVVLSVIVTRKAQLLAAGCGSAFCMCHLLLKLSGCSGFLFKNKEDKSDLWFGNVDLLSRWDCTVVDKAKPHFGLHLNHAIFQAPCLNTLEVQDVM